MSHSRRDFLGNCCKMLGAGAFAAGLERFGRINLYAQELAPTDYKALVCIFLFGGNDPNNTLIPLTGASNTNYYNVRNASGLALPAGSLLPITPTSIGQQFGLHPNLPEIQQLFVQKKLAIITNVGPLIEPLTQAQYQGGSPAAPYSLFSHSDQQTQWQTGRSDKVSNIGWGGLTSDYVVSQNGGAAFPLITSVSGVSTFAIGLQTSPLSIGTGALNKVLVLNGFNSSPQSTARLNTMDYLRTIDNQASLIAAASRITSGAVDIGRSLTVDPSLTTVFPSSTIGSQLQQVAKVIKFNQTVLSPALNRQIFFCSFGSFDTHQNQLTTQQTLLTDLSQAMNAFHQSTITDLNLESNITTFTLSDFGRTFQPSGSGATVGTDHGWGGHQFVMGGAVNGGDFFGIQGPNGSVFPDLSLGGLNDTDTGNNPRGRWIPTAAVDQYAATLATWFGLPASNLTDVFPLIDNFPSSNLGFV